MKVWALTDEWVQDFENGLTVVLYSRLGDAQAHMEEVIEENHNNGIEYDIENQDDMHYEGYNDGDYNHYHTNITIELKEIN